MTSAEQQIAEDETVNLNDIIGFFLTYWKLLLIGTASGLIAALIWVFIFGKYEAKATLVNRQGVDYLGWKDIKRNLPIIAAKVSESAEGDFFHSLASEAWWDKNVVVTFSMEKDDAKTLASVPKEMQERESTKIKNFAVKALGADKEEALKNLAIATSFLRSTATYLALNNVIASYQLGLKNAEAEADKNISATEIELIYLNSRMDKLEQIKVGTPANVSTLTVNSPLEAKYLPIATQLAAAKQDINGMKEKLTRLREAKDQLVIKSNFLSQAMPVMSRGFDGLQALTAVMQIETGMRKNLPPSGWSSIHELDSIRHDLTVVRTSFVEGLEQPVFVNTGKPDHLKPAVIGLLAGFFFTLLGSVCSVILLRYRRQAHQLKNNISP